MLRPSFRDASHSASKTRANALMASEPGIQLRAQSLYLDSGFVHLRLAGSGGRPGMTRICLTRHRIPFPLSPNTEATAGAEAGKISNNDTFHGGRHASIRLQNHRV